MVERLRVSLAVHPRRGWWTWTALVCLAAGCGLLLEDDAWSRAGGGGGYRGGGSFGGRGFGGGGGDGDGIALIIMLLIELCIHHPAVGFPLTAVVLGVGAYMYLRGDSVWQGNQATIAPTMPAPEALEKGLQELRATDPHFETAAFQARVGQTFLQIQQAWSDGQLDRIRHLCSQGVYERFDNLLKMYELQDLHNTMEETRVVDVTLLHCDSDDTFDTLQVRIDAVAVDTMRRRSDGHRVYGGRREGFAEFWSFIRRRSTQTKSSGLAEGNCPNCGAGLRITDRGECDSCTAVVNSGAYDWVLSEITQTAAGWSTRRSLANVPALRQSDPGFHPQFIEDRVSVLFWRLRLAEMTGETKLVHNFVSEAHLAELRRRWQVDRRGRRTFYADPAVGAVEAYDLRLDVNGRDVLKVRVKWSGHQEVARVPSPRRPDYDRSRPFDQTFVLSRAHGVTTDADRGFAAGNCEQCGGPETLDDTGRCGYCGAERSSGSVSWVLDAVEPFYGYGAARPRHHVAAARQPDMDDVLVTLIHLVDADGRRSQAELEMLQAFARHHNIAPRHVQMLLGATRRREVPEFRMTSRRHKMAFMDTMISLALADGHLCAEEQDLLQAVIRTMRLPREDADRCRRRAGIA